MDWKSRDVVKSNIHGGEEIETHLKKRDEMKATFFDYLKDFREYLAEYVRESVTELSAGSVKVNGTIELFDGISAGKVTLKNQGRLSCYVSTMRGNGYELIPGERVEFFLNNKLNITTLSGTTTVGFIKS